MDLGAHESDPPKPKFHGDALNDWLQPPPPSIGFGAPIQSVECGGKHVHGYGTKCQNSRSQRTKSQRTKNSKDEKSNSQKVKRKKSNHQKVKMPKTRRCKKSKSQKVKTAKSQMQKVKMPKSQRCQKVKCKKSNAKSQMQNSLPNPPVPPPGHLWPGPTPRSSLSRSHLRPSLSRSHLRSSMPRSSLFRCRSPVLCPGPTPAPIPLTGSLFRSHPAPPSRFHFPVLYPGLNPGSLSRSRPGPTPGPLSGLTPQFSVPVPLPGSLSRSHPRSSAPVSSPGPLSRSHSPVLCPGPVPVLCPGPVPVLCPGPVPVPSRSRPGPVLVLLPVLYPGPTLRFYVAVPTRSSVPMPFPGSLSRSSLPRSSPSQFHPRSAQIRFHPLPPVLILSHPGPLSRFQSWSSVPIPPLFLCPSPTPVLAPIPSVPVTFPVCPGSTII